MKAGSILCILEIGRPIFIYNSGMKWIADYNDFTQTDHPSKRIRLGG